MTWARGSRYLVISAYRSFSAEDVGELPPLLSLGFVFVVPSSLPLGLTGANVGRFLVSEI